MSGVTHTYRVTLDIQSPAKLTKRSITRAFTCPAWSFEEFNPHGVATRVAGIIYLARVDTEAAK